MTTQTTAKTLGQSAIRTEIAAIFTVALIGLGIVFVAGHAQASALHDAAHDVRHATGFPCH
ncbi:CbtB domain-containing protein [Pseudooceanicola nitratireducens]|jgi:cobalt transporter subunit CbtB|uniref:CbtB domain-containing protein n=1 Tax=Pseudooceanicola nitratireducens TaxID=517719 RepID=UPI001C9533CB|nr:CbtB domain-containing protein [Pseudooceanicola nitratireducens]MEC7298380.1 CbtB domain-containing protein [Pseudomonadota bacterium]MBY6157833.1 CbtB-domain containing protein [Pseudooceanicola nitratireducens]MBY6164635.1 CbtB-domain containing protein [Pseudooceanicola nitratireducens]MEC7792800.1 CbtB domain-containing protein [Pseudomonadota bacterium]MEC9102302.1 CbtB domain-containing protein [Pseudomonadota bacterium]